MAKVSIGLHRGNTRLLLALILVIGVGFGINGQIRPKADTVSGTVSGTESFFSNRTIPVSVRTDGTVTVNGIEVTDTITRLADADELRIPIIDGARTHTIAEAGVAIRLVSDVPLTVNDSYPIAYAIHGASLVSPKPTIINPTTAEWTISSLSAEGAISIAAHWPRGSFHLNSRALMRTLPTVVPWWGWLALGLVPVLIAWVLIQLSQRKWRSSGTPPQESSPPSTLSAAAAGALVLGRANPAQLAAVLVTMATRGDIQIVQSPTGYRVARRRPMMSMTVPEKILLEELRLGLGPVTSAEKVETALKERLFDARIAEAYSGLTDELRQRGLLAPQTVAPKSSYRFTGLIALLISIIGAVYCALQIPNGTTLLGLWFGWLVAGWMLLLRIPSLPNLTSVGRAERERWLGFRAFLAERSLVGGSQGDANLFLEYLPYAVAFNVVGSWLQRFNSDFILIPNWYYNSGAPADTHQFATDIQSISTQIAEDLTKAALPQ